MIVYWLQVMLLYTSSFPHRELSTIWKSFMVMQHRQSFLLRINHHFVVDSSFYLPVVVKTQDDQDIYNDQLWFVYVSMMQASNVLISRSGESVNGEAKRHNFTAFRSLFFLNFYISGNSSEKSLPNGNRDKLLKSVLKFDICQFELGGFCKEIYSFSSIFKTGEREQENDDSKETFALFLSYLLWT